MHYFYDMISENKCLKYKTIFVHNNRPSVETMQRNASITRRMQSYASGYTIPLSKMGFW